MLEHNFVTLCHANHPVAFDSSPQVHANNMQRKDKEPLSASYKP